MRLLGYYALHTFKNQIKKLCRTWVLIFLLVCFAVGIAAGAFSAMLGGSSDGPEPAAEAAETETETAFWERLGVGQSDLVELAVGGVALAVFAFFALGADKNGSRIFLPADVDLLFASPMKPQSVLMFRLSTQLGVSVLGSAYILIQIPNLTGNMGLSLWATVSLVAAWALAVAFGTLIRVLLYMLSNLYPAVKRSLRWDVYALLGVIAAGYMAYAARSGEGSLAAAVSFFNGGATRYIPIWGWLKGFCAFAAEGNGAGAALCLGALGLGGAALVYVIWHVKADFYEDAMARSEQTAELMAAAQSERPSNVMVRRKKDRSEKLRRDGMGHGAGANVFFFKAMYNRFRFAQLGAFTKTMELYLVAAVGVAAICRYTGNTGSALPVGLTLAGLSFFRALGNPLAQDTNMDYFVLIPESTWAKLFWSVMGGSANCLLDALPAVVIGALAAGANPLTALAWLPLIVSVDFYATNVGAFIGLSVPVSAGKTLKQLIQVLFVYFGLLPDIAVVAAGIAFGHAAPALLGAAVLNIGLGLVFFALTPLFIDPRDGKRPTVSTASQEDIRLAGKRFSRLGLGLFVMLAASTVLQLGASALVGRLYPAGDEPGWALWLATFAPMYLAAVPLGLALFRRVPAVPREKHGMKAGQLVTAAVISIFLMYAGNLVGSLILSLLHAALGISAENPLLVYTRTGDVWVRVLVMVILAPIIEEYIFRKQLIDRMSVYGEKLAVTVSALLFGLFHGNLSQFFYAFALGLLLGYVYLRTGRLRYSAGLHLFINLLGGVAAPAILDSIGLDSLDAIGAGGAGVLVSFVSRLLPLVAYLLAMLALSVTGLVLLCVRARRVYFDPAPLELPRGRRFKTVYGNAGMLLFIAGSLGMTALTFLS